MRLKECLQKTQESLEKTRSMKDAQDTYLIFDIQELEQRYHKLHDIIIQTQENAKYLLETKDKITKILDKKNDDYTPEQKKDLKNNIREIIKSKKSSEWLQKTTDEKLQSQKCVSKIHSYVEQMKEIESKLPRIENDKQLESFNTLKKTKDNQQFEIDSLMKNIEQNINDTTTLHKTMTVLNGYNGPSHNDAKNNSKPRSKSSTISDNDKNNKNTSEFWRNISWEKSSAIGTLASNAICTAIGITLFSYTSIFQTHTTITICSIILAAIVFSVISTLIIHKYNQRDIDEPHSKLNDTELCMMNQQCQTLYLK